MILGKQAIMNNFTWRGWHAWRGDTPLCAAELDKIVGPNSVDVTLGHNLLIPSCPAGVLDPYAPNIDYITHLTEGYVLLPGEFCLGVVQERFATTAPIDNEQFVQVYEGRSTCGRMGLASHVTAGLGDYGFEGFFTLELVNHAPYSIRLHEGMRVGQVVFVRVKDPSVYMGVYSQEQACPKAPVLGRHRFVLTD
jgi:dCTP deaminase